jgi:acyl transferase domain-containing protein
VTKPVLFLFAGQGSQCFHMAREIAENCPAVRDRLYDLDAVAREELGCSVLDIVFDPARGRFDPFDRLLYSNPALFMVQYALADALIAQGARPTALMGASLGEIVAMSVAGAMSAPDALRMVIAMSASFERDGAEGGLIAVLTDPGIVAERPDLFARVEIAGISSASHFIAAGPAEDLARIESVLGAEGHACMVMPVRFPFHSSYVEPARTAMEAVFRGKDGQTLHLPLISCVTATAMDRVPEGHLWRIVREPMRIADAYRGLESRQASLFVDLSPSGTMATVAKYNLGPDSASEAVSVMSLFGNEWAGYQAVRQRLGIGV